MIIEIVTDITTEPVTITEVKAALRITGSAHDDDLSDMISDARRFVERATDSSVSERSLKVTSDLEMEDWEMPFGPVIGDITSSTNSDSQYIYEYSAGYDPTPPDMKRLILDVIEHWYDKGDNDRLPETIKRKIQLLTRNP
jgi:DNA-directed RNA polymerase subunit F